MKTILISLTAAAALAAAAAPAAAQDWRGQSDNGRYDQRQDYGRPDYSRQDYGRNLSTAYVDSLDWKITNAVRNRVISQREGQQLRAEFRQVQTIAWKVQNGQASRWERQRLETTVARIEQALNRYAANDRRGPNYGPGYGNDQRGDGRR